MMTAPSASGAICAFVEYADPMQATQGRFAATVLYSFIYPFICIFFIYPRVHIFILIFIVFRFNLTFSWVRF